MNLYFGSFEGILTMRLAFYYFVLEAYSMQVIVHDTESHPFFFLLILNLFIYYYYYFKIFDLFGI